MELMNKCELIGTKPGEGIHTQAGHSEFLEFRSELFQKYGLEGCRIATKPPISFPTVSTGLIYKTTTCIDEFTLNKNIAIGGKITTSDMCQFYSRSPVLHPSQKHVEIQNNGLSTTAWLTMAEAIKDIDSFWNLSKSLIASIEKLLAAKFVARGRMTRAGIEQTTVSLCDRNIELGINGKVLFPNMNVAHPCTVSVLISPKNFQHSLDSTGFQMAPAFAACAMQPPFNAIHVLLNYGFVPCVRKKIRTKAMDGLIFSGLLYALKQKDVRLIWLVGTVLARDALLRNKSEGVIVQLLEFLTVVQCQLTRESKRSHAYVELRHSLGEIFEAKGNFEAAISCYKSVIQIMIQHPFLERNQLKASMFWYHLGLAHKRNCDWKDAEKCYKKAISILAGERKGESKIFQKHRFHIKKLADLYMTMMSDKDLNRDKVAKAQHKSSLNELKRKWIDTFSPLFSHVLVPYAIWRNGIVEGKRGYEIQIGAGGIAELKNWGMYYDDEDDTTVFIAGVMQQKKKKKKCIKAWYIDAREDEMTAECIELQTIAEAKKTVPKESYSFSSLMNQRKNYVNSSSSNMKAQLRKESKIPKNIKVCSFCGKQTSTNLKCSKCKMAMYCNVECQRCDWKTHKKKCVVKKNKQKKN